MKGSQYALKTGDGQPLLGIYKDAKWFPDINFCEMNCYVCRTCGYFEMYVEDLEKLNKLEDCDNWRKVEENQPQHRRRRINQPNFYERKSIE